MTQPLMPIPPCCPVALLGVGAAPLMVTLLIVSLSLGTSFAQESIPHSRLLLSGCQVLMAAIVAWWIIDQRLLGHAQPVVALVPVADALNHHHQSQVGCRSSIICGLCLTPTHQPGCCHTISHLVGKGRPHLPSLHAKCKGSMLSFVLHVHPVLVAAASTYPQGLSYLCLRVLTMQAKPHFLHADRVCDVQAASLPGGGWGRGLPFGPRGASSCLRRHVKSLPMHHAYLSTRMPCSQSPSVCSSRSLPGQRHGRCPATVPWDVPLQVDDSYGRKSHAEFLTGYGFLPTTEVDEYGIDLLTLLQSRPDFPQERLGALVTTGGSIVLETLQKVSAAQA